VYMSLGNIQMAVKCVEQSLAIRREIGDLNGAGTDSFNLVCGAKGT